MRVLLCVLVLAGCKSRIPDLGAGACEVGASQACVCSTGAAGTQMCLDGDTYDVCDCVKTLGLDPKPTTVAAGLPFSIGVKLQDDAMAQISESPQKPVTVRLDGAD